MDIRTHMRHVKGSRSDRALPAFDNSASLVLESVLILYVVESRSHGFNRIKGA